MGKITLQQQIEKTERQTEFNNMCLQTIIKWFKEDKVLLPNTCGFEERRLSQFFEMHTPEPNCGPDLLFQEGKINNKIAFLLDGEAEVTYKDQHISIIHPGQIIGEMEFVSDDMHGIATVRISANSHCMVLDFSEYPEIKEHLLEFPHFLRMCLKQVSSRLSANNEYFCRLQDTDCASQVAKKILDQKVVQDTGCFWRLNSVDVLSDELNFHRNTITHALDTLISRGVIQKIDTQSREQRKKQREKHEKNTKYNGKYYIPDVEKLKDFVLSNGKVK